MKKLVFILFAVILFASACKKESARCTFTTSTQVATQAEKDSIQRYLTANSLTAIADPSGVYYNVTTQGTGTVNPGVCSYLTVRYSGRLFTGQLFDGTNGNAVAGFTLGSLIVGWQKGLTRAPAGTTIVLYIPPSLAYGAEERRDANNNVTIPANSYLRFTIDVVQVQ